jgi:hypothetical protein
MKLFKGETVKKWKKGVNSKRKCSKNKEKNSIDYLINLNRILETPS